MRGMGSTAHETGGSLREATGGLRRESFENVRFYHERVDLEDKLKIYST